MAINTNIDSTSTDQITCIQSQIYTVNYTVTDSYVDSAIIDCRLSTNVGLQFDNGTVNSLVYSIYGCINSTNWITVQSDTTLSASASTIEAVDTSYLVSLKVKLKNAVAGSVCTANVYVCNKSV